MRDIFAAVAALVSMFAVAPYIRDIVRGKTKPNIVSWFTWSVLTGIATAAAFAAHEPRTALLTLGSTCATGAIVVLGLRRGIAKFSRLDIFCQLGAVAGLACWLIFNSPLVGIVIPVCIDFVAMIPTLRHAWSRPGEETWQTFMVGAVAPVFTLLSVTHYTIASVLYPVYLLVANGLIGIAVLGRRKQLGVVLTEGAII